MSSTPPNQPPPGRPPPGPNGPFMKVRRQKADPLVRPKKKPPPRPPGQGLSGGPLPNGIAAPKPRPPQAAPKAHPPAVPPKPTILSADDLTVNGFSGPLLSESYVDYPLVTTKRAWREGLKHHVAKFASKKHIDPRDESQFTRPVRLQRRDPRASNIGPAADKNDQPPRKPGDHLTEAEREELEAKKAAREKERAENLAQIAPSASTTQKKTNAPKQRTQQVFKSEMTPQEIARARIKYEEALPWHLDDFDNKGTWVGNYEAAMSETYAMFVLQNDGKMRMVPIDKWYKFNTKSPFKTLTIEEAEKFMAKKIKDPRWFMEKEQDRAQKKELEAYAKQNKLFTGRSRTETFPGATEGFEGDDLDFEEDRFADDEEHVGIFDEDEDAKTAERRIKEDQLKANIFDLKDEKMYDEEENQEKREKEELKNFGKRVRKALQRREKNFDYSSGSDANPYSDDESSEDSEAERQKEEQRKLEEERLRKEKGKDSDKNNSGTSTKGTNTPSGRPKHTDPLNKKVASRSARKRPGSPNLSEASGTDTSRKKPKSKHAADAQPDSRPMSPAPGAQRKPAPADQASKKRARNGPGAGGGSGSGSDGERGAGSGGEMSDAAAKKPKLNPPGVKSKTGTPRGSRAGSPAVPGRGPGSGASSPDPTGRGSQPRTSTPVPPNGGAFPTAAEIHSSIPATGIASGELLKIFRPRIGDSKENHRRFIAIVRDVTIYGKEDRLLRPGTLKGA
ncbi:hypothetical protein AJ79_01121 [Helicocarpus griseus UAMH5409]|uniref:Transcription initiation factor IIF subunit alpha n=1 Tax=Helicocarpus griseus UAMH5409 TaxID=1447875 RepID=A0A2B7Y8Y7_9EURO|nr:hypothetical protein AJ79_01121 [Helicocarpus griseus UAMH5409]